MREDTTGNAQPLDRAWTTPKRRVANVVPAPMREDTTGNNQPLDLAGNTMQSDAYGSGPRSQT